MAQPPEPLQQPRSNFYPSLHRLLGRSSLGRGPSPGTVHQTLASAANLANLLPTGTVLAFQALTPSFSNGGSCHVSNRFLTAVLVASFSVVCFLSSFTDSFLGSSGKIYYGIATPRGLYVFNDMRTTDEEEVEVERERDLAKYKIRLMDFVHAFVSLVVFLIIALGDPHVVECFFGRLTAADANNALLVNLPLGAGALASFLFMLFPTNRRGIGYADMVTG